jgi:predicted MPP superfamily phosphohydrolase
MVFFLTIVSAVLLSAHFFLYFSIIHFFGVANATVKNLLFYGFLFLAISFVLSSLMAHRWDSLFTRFYYFLSSVWIGLLASLLAASFFIWLIIIINNYFSFNINKIFFSSIIFSLAIIISAYGIWSAFNFKIKNIEVGIKDLPDSWNGKTIVQLSDVHLGLINRLFFAKKITKLVNSIDHDLVVITGDLFDGQAVDLRCFVGPLNEIRAEKGIYLVTGNHETYFGTDKAYSLLSETKIIPLKDEIVGLDGLNIIGISYPEERQKKNISNVLRSLEGYNANEPNILLYHEPVQIAEIAKSGIDLELCGHTHRGQLWPFNFVTNFMYKGFDYGLHTIGDYTLYITNGTGTWGPPMRTLNPPEIVAIRLIKK